MSLQSIANIGTLCDFTSENDQEFCEEPALQEGLRGFADVFANFSYSLVVGVPVDLVYWKMNASQVVGSRISNVGLASITGKWNGDWVNTCRKLCKAKEPGIWQYIVDSGAQTLFWVVPYSATVGLLKGSADQAMQAAKFIGPLCLAVGGPNGWWINQVRNWTAKLCTTNEPTLLTQYALEAQTRFEA